MNFLLSKFVKQQQQQQKNNNNNNNNDNQYDGNLDEQDDRDRDRDQDQDQEEDLASLISSAPTDEITLVADVAVANADADVIDMDNEETADRDGGRHRHRHRHRDNGNGRGCGSEYYCSDEFELFETETTVAAAAATATATAATATTTIDHDSGNGALMQKQQQRHHTHTHHQQLQRQHQKKKKQVVHVMNIDISSSSTSHNTSSTSRGSGGYYNNNYNCPPPPSTDVKKNKKTNGKYNKYNKFDEEPSPSPLVIRNRNRKKEKQQPMQQVQHQMQQQQPLPAPSAVNEEEEEETDRRLRHYRYREQHDKINEDGPIDVDEVVVSSYEEDDEDETLEDHQGEENQEDDHMMILPVKLRYDDDDDDDDLHADDDGNDEHHQSHQQQQLRQSSHRDASVSSNDVVTDDGNNNNDHVIIIQDVLKDMVDAVDKANELIMSPTPPVVVQQQQQQQQQQQPLSSSFPSSITAGTSKSQMHPQPQPQPPQPQGSNASGSSSSSTNRVISTWFSLQSSFLRKHQQQRQEQRRGKDDDDDKEDKMNSVKNDGTLETMDSPADVAEDTVAVAKVAAAAADDHSGGSGGGSDNNPVDGAVAVAVVVDRERSMSRSDTDGKSNSSSSSTINNDTTPLPSDEFQNVEGKEGQRGDRPGNEQMTTTTVMATSTPVLPAASGNHHHHLHHHHEKFDDIIHEHVDLYSSGSGSDNDHDHDDVYHTDSSSSPVVSSPPPLKTIFQPDHTDVDVDVADRVKIDMKNRKNEGISQHGTKNKGNKILPLALASSSSPSDDKYHDDDIVVHQTMTEETDDMITMTTICPSRSVDDENGNDNYDDNDEYRHNYSDDDDDGDVYPHYSARNHDNHHDRFVSTNTNTNDTNIDHENSSAENSEENDDDDDDDALQALEAFVTYAKDASPNTSSKLVDQLQRLDPVLTPLCDKSRVKTPQDILARNNNFDYDSDGLKNKNSTSYDSPDAKDGAISTKNTNGNHPNRSGIDLTDEDGKHKMEQKLSPDRPRPRVSSVSSPTVAEVFAVTGSAVMAVESTMRDVAPPPRPPPSRSPPPAKQQHHHPQPIENDSIHQKYQVEVSKPEKDVGAFKQFLSTPSKLDFNEDHKNASIDVQQQQDATSSSVNGRNKSLLDDDDDDNNQDDGSRNLIDLSYFSTTSSWGEIERPPPTVDEMSTDEDDFGFVIDMNKTDTPHEDKSPMSSQSATSTNDDDENAYGSYTVDNSSIGCDLQDLIADATSNAAMWVAAPSIASSTMMSISMEPDDGVSVEDQGSRKKVGNAKAQLILAEMDTLPSGISPSRETEEESNKSQALSSSFMSPSAKGPVEKVDLTAATPLVSNVATSNHKETIGLQTSQRTTNSARKGSVKVIKSPADEVKHTDYIQLVTNTSAASITPQKSNRKGDPLSPALSCRSEVEDTKPPLEDGADMQFGDTPSSPKVAGGLFGRESPPLSPCQGQDHLMLPVQEIATRIRSTNTPERVTSSSKKHRKSRSFDSSPFIPGEEYLVRPSPKNNRYGTPIGPQKAYDDMNVSYDITASGRLIKSKHQTPKDSPTPQKRKSSFMDWLMPQRTTNPWRLWQGDDDDSSPRPLPSILGISGGLDASCRVNDDHQSVSDLESPNLATPVVDYKKFDFSDEESTIQSQEGVPANLVPISAEKSETSATADRDVDILSSQASELIGSTVVDDVHGQSIKSQQRPENIVLTESTNKPHLELKDKEPIPPSPQSLLTMSIIGCPTDEDHSPKNEEAADSLVASAVRCAADGGAVDQTSSVAVMSQSALTTSQQCPTDEGRLSSTQQADNQVSLSLATQRHPTDESRSLFAVQDATQVTPIGVPRNKKNRNSLSSLPEDEPLLCEIPTANMDDKSYAIEDFDNPRRSFCSGRCIIITSILLTAGIVVGALLLTGTIETSSNPSSGTLPLPLPTEIPTSEPSVSPISESPTTAPTLEPTVEPTFVPSATSFSPTTAPSSTTTERTSSPTTEYEGQLLWNRIETGEDVWRTFLGEQGINTPRWYFSGGDEDGSPTTSGGIQLDIVNAAAERYSSVLGAVVDDYSASRAVVDLNVVDVPYDVLCRPEIGKVKICSGDFGPTQWPGTSVLFLRGDLIVAAILQINSGTSSATTPSYMKHSICHHFGHILGIPHQKDSTSCMNDLRLDEQAEEIGGRQVMIPEEWQHPNDDDLDELVDIYGPAPTRRRRRQLDRYRLRGSWRK